METEYKIFETVIKSETQISSLGDWKDCCHRNMPNYYQYVFAYYIFILVFLSLKIPFSTVNRN